MKKVKLLVVDDASFIRDLVKKAVKDRFPHFIFEEAINGKKAMSMLEKSEYDLVLCDWEMPELSGLELLQWMRNEYQYNKTPFIMVTSRGDKENVVQAIQAGVSEYIGKPFSNDQLVKKVIKVLSKRLPRDVLEGKATKSALESSVSQGSISALGAKAVGGAPAKAPPQKAAPAQSGSVAALTGGTSAAAKPQAGKKPTKGPAQLRVHDKTIPCEIQDISLKEAKVIASREHGIPQLLDTAVIDLQQNDSAGDVARINCLIHTLQAPEKNINAGNIVISVVFVDEDPQKFDYLSKFIASGSGKKYW
ncbi:response regulator [Endozoicomonas sp. SM1973]|uniref:Response regulator n=1 Tax=Spartinivicinus marinus TaxID=2994442 RepID=A0A853I468_9GAMM|nr:response regulator [Spartinivicinus marinus]MCX4026550.1 response regulator [Spartinivicinus marinus]NYZ64387.1 response regulator [Spartinivicinus marinus]